MTQCQGRVEGSEVGHPIAENYYLYRMMAYKPLVSIIKHCISIQVCIEWQACEYACMECKC